MNSSLIRYGIAAWIVAVCAAPIPSIADDYGSHVKPLLKEKCFACHGAVKQEAGLRLDAGKLILKGSEDGPVITPGKSTDSKLIARVLSTGDDRMPPKDEGEPLSAEELGVLKKWIDVGAPIPDDEPILTDPRQHWTYQVPKQSPLPKVANTAWAANPIDALLAAKQERAGVKPARAADRALLLRRVTLDLIGLPPTPEEIQTFLADEAPDAYARVVDRLLESPHYGERWGRHWMDVWRYSDWDGYKEEVRNSQKHVWRWRDWIVESLNADKGYDRMIHEMLAADELCPEDRDALRATGFLARNYNLFNRDQWLDSVVEHTSKAFLGITLNCARCHDHKYDPIPQTDYYTFRAIFQPYKVRLDRLPGETNVTKAGLARIYDEKLDTPTYLYKRGNEKDPDKDKPLSPGVPAALGGKYEIKPVELPIASWFPALKEYVERDDIAVLEAAAAKSEQALAEAKSLAADDPKREAAELNAKSDRAALASLKARWAADRAKYLASSTDESLAETAADLERDANLAAALLDVHQKEQALETAETKAAAVKAGTAAAPKTTAAKKAAAPEQARKNLDAAQLKLDQVRMAIEEGGATYTSVGTIYGKTSSGRRLALAKWITAPDHPTAARVAVNQMWMRHFGTPLVDLVVDFGLNSPEPVQRDLLDWLAVELMTGGSDGRPWSMKHVHRLMVLSQAYQSSSNPDDAPAENLTADRENKLYWRSNVRRLEAEIVRDCVLAESGSLDRKLGGEDVPFTAGETSSRRSVYFQTAYEKQMLMLTLFDAANPADCYRRTESVIPQQALALSNSSLFAKEARVLAAKLSESSPSKDNATFVKDAFLLILNRHASSPELSACLAFLDQQQARLTKTDELTPITGGPKPTKAPSADPAQRAREDLILSLLNHNDSVTVR